MRWSKRHLFGPLLAAALLSVGLVPDTASAQQAVTIQLAAQNNSGITGTATLTPQGNQTRVVLALTGAGAGPEPAHIHAGTCTNLTPAPAFPLTPVANGASETMVNAPLSQVQGAAHAINVHKSPQEAAVYVSCGNIPMLASTAAPAPAAPAAAAPAAQPAQLPRSGEADFLLFGLASLGAVLIVSGASLMLRRRPR